MEPTFVWTNFQTKKQLSGFSTNFATKQLFNHPALSYMESSRTICSEIQQNKFFSRRMLSTLNKFWPKQVTSDNEKPYPRLILWMSTGNGTAEIHFL